MFHGSMVALVTPFLPDSGEVDYPSLSKLVEMHIEAGTSAIVAAGTTGESACLSFDEKINVIRHCVDAAKERVPVIAGTGAQSTKATIELTDAAIHVGADGALIMTPAYIKPTQDGLYQHYYDIAHAVALPIILYNVPGRTSVDLLPDTVERLANVPNIVGIKEASGDLARVEAILSRCGERIDIYSGEDALTAAMLKLGAKGVISVAANVVPAEMAALCAGDESNSVNSKLQGLFEALFLETNPIPVKWAMQEMGLISGAIRLPLTTLSGPHQGTLRKVLDDLDLLK